MVKRIFSKGLEQLDEVLRTVSDALAFANFPHSTISQVLLATEEIYCRIVKYAYINSMCDVLFSYQISEEPLSVTIRFSDYGIPFNPLKLKAPAFAATIQDDPIVGLENYIAKRSMDEAKYRYYKGNNILVMKKSAYEANC